VAILISYKHPFRHISLFDFTEKKEPVRPNGLNQGPNIFDFLGAADPYFVSEPAKSEHWPTSRISLCRCEKNRFDFAFLYWAELETGLLHRLGNDSPEISGKLRLYERWLEGLLLAARFITPSACLPVQ